MSFSFVSIATRGAKEHTMRTRTHTRETHKHMTRTHSVCEQIKKKHIYKYTYIYTFMHRNIIFFFSFMYLSRDLFFLIMMIKKMSHLTNIVSVKSFNCFLSFVIFSKKIVYTEYIDFFFEKWWLNRWFSRLFFLPLPLWFFKKSNIGRKPCV